MQVHFKRVEEKRMKEKKERKRTGQRRYSGRSIIILTPFISCGPVLVLIVIAVAFVSSINAMKQKTLRSIDLPEVSQIRRKGLEEFALLVSLASRHSHRRQGDQSTFGTRNLVLENVILSIHFFCSLYWL